VVCASKAEYAVIAAGMVGRLGRRGWGAVRVIMTKLEDGQRGIGARHLRKSAKRYQQTLHGNGVGDDNRDQRPPERKVFCGSFQHAAPAKAAIMGTVIAGVNASSLEPFNSTGRESYFERMRMKAWRRHSATSLLS
jgi:hypothetical protein